MSSSSPSSSDSICHTIYAVTSILLAIAIIVVILRAYVRLGIGKNFGLDDGFICLTLGLLIAGDVCIFKMVADGVGRPLASLPAPEEAAFQILKWNTIYQAININGALFTKISIGLFILRIRNDRTYKFVVWTVLTPLGIMTMILTLIILLQCIPLQALWNPTMKGHCISAEIPLRASYVQSGFAIITDLFLTVSPIAILWNIKISFKRKISICGLMSLGLMATIANALRNAFIPDLTASDLSYTIAPIVIVADLEFSLGVIAACMPAIVPLFKSRQVNNTYAKSSGQFFDNSSAGRGYPRQISSNDVELSQTYLRTETHTRIESNGSAKAPLTGYQETQIPCSKSWTVEYSPA